MRNLGAMLGNAPVGGGLVDSGFFGLTGGSVALTNSSLDVAYLLRDGIPGSSGGGNLAEPLSIAPVASGLLVVSWQAAVTISTATHTLDRDVLVALGMSVTNAAALAHLQPYSACGAHFKEDASGSGPSMTFEVSGEASLQVVTGTTYLFDLTGITSSGAGSVALESSFLTGNKVAGMGYKLFAAP